MTFETSDQTPFNEWYQEYKYYFPDYLMESTEENTEYIYFLQYVYRKYMAEVVPELLKLMMEHYPVFGKECRQKVLERFYEISLSASHKLICLVYELLQDHSVGLDLRNKYPEFEKWQEFYTAPRIPDHIDESTRELYPFYDDKEWEEYVKSENKAFLEYHNWYENRITSFSNLLNLMLRKHYPKINELDADGRVMLIVYITDQYELYKTECEHLELIIDCGFPEEDIDLNYTDLADKYSQLDSEFRKQISNLRERRIGGEKI